jgi:hypothetical protein
MGRTRFPFPLACARDVPPCPLPEAVSCRLSIAFRKSPDALSAIACTQPKQLYSTAESTELSCSAVQSGLFKAANLGYDAGSGPRLCLLSPYAGGATEVTMVSEANTKQGLPN